MWYLLFFFTIIPTSIINMKPEKIAKLQELENALQEFDTLLQDPLTDHKKISPKALAQIEQIRSIAKQHRQALDNSPEMKGSEKDIKIDESISFIDFWETVSDELSELSDSLKPLAGLLILDIDKEKIAKCLANLKLLTPFGNEFRTTLQNSLEDVQKVGDICDAFTVSIKTHLSDKAKAREHYNENRAFYQGSTTITDEVSRDIQFFNAVIDVVPEAITSEEYVVTTDAYKEEQEKRNQIKKAILDWNISVATQLDAKMSEAKMTKKTFLDCVVIVSNLKEAFKSNEEEEELKLMRDALVHVFENQIQIQAHLAKDGLYNKVSSLAQNKEYIALYLKNKNIVPSFPEAGKIAAAIADALVGAGNDLVAYSTFEQYVTDWKKNAIAAFSTLPKDNEKYLDKEVVAAFSNVLSRKSHNAFSGFWEQITGTFEMIFESVQQAKDLLKETINDWDTSGLYNSLKDHQTYIFPDLQALAGYVNEASLDTSYAHYLQQWEDWKKTNLPANIGINTNATYRAGLMVGFEIFRKYFYGISVGYFAYEEWGRLLKEQEALTKTDKITGSDLQRIWEKFISIAPSRAYFEQSVKRIIGGRELFQYITSYTKLLPTCSKIQQVIGNYKEGAANGNGYKLKISGLLEGHFNAGNIMDKLIMELGFVKLDRGFVFDVDIVLKEKNGMFYASAVDASVILRYGVELESNKGKINLSPKFEEAKMENGKTVQNFSITIPVAGFGDKSYSSGYGFGKEGAYQDSAPIGSANYTVSMQLVTEKVDKELKTYIIDRTGTVVQPELFDLRLSDSNKSTIMAENKIKLP